MKKVVFIKNAAILTVSSLLIRFLGMAFRIRIATLLGAAGVGLHQLVFSAYVLFSSFATTGLCTAATRLCAEELDRGSSSGARTVLNRCIGIGLIISALTIAVTVFFAKPISLILGDERGKFAIRLMGFPIPFVATTSCLRGYFTARGRTVSIGFSQLFEQIVRIITVLFLFSFPLVKGSVAYSVGAVIAGDVVGEVAAFLFIFTAYRFDKNRLFGLSLPSRQNLNQKIKHISVPITAEKYLNSLLRTTENSIMPRSLKKYNSSSAMPLFGAMKGMAMPLVLFPLSVISSVSTLIIPEMSTAAAGNKLYKIKYTASRMLCISSICSFLLAVFYFAFADFLGNTVYKNSDVGMLLRYLSPIIPLIFADSAADGMLKGLDCQRFLFFTAVGDSLLRIILVIIFVPRYGIAGFLGITALSNLLTALLKVARLLSRAKMRFDAVNCLARPLFSGAAALYIISAIKKAPLGTMGLPLSVLCGTAVYFLALYLLGMRKNAVL